MVCGMKIDIIALPRMLTDAHVRNRAVVVFDVLRATTTMVTAISNGAKEIRVFGSLDAAALAASEFDGPKILAGESKCLPPPGFDLGNSPGDFTPERVAGKTIFLSTTNGTKAIVAAQRAAMLFAGAVVNATAVAALLGKLGMDVTLLCSGTDGQVAPEDRRGADLVRDALRLMVDDVVSEDEPLMGRAIAEMRNSIAPNSDTMALEFRRYPGGRNVIHAGLDRDIVFAAQRDQFNTIVEITGPPPVARKLEQ
jgi:2-phosphosulfolactate phosphatase